MVETAKVEPPTAGSEASTEGDTVWVSGNLGRRRGGELLFLLPLLLGLDLLLKRSQRCFINLVLGGLVACLPAKRASFIPEKAPTHRSLNARPDGWGRVLHFRFTKKAGRKNEDKSPRGKGGRTMAHGRAAALVPWSLW